MPTSGEILRGLNNVEQFIELATAHQQGLVRDGIVFRAPIPMYLRPYTAVRQGYPVNRVARWDYVQGVSKAKIIDEQDRAPYGSRDQFGVEMKDPLHMAGHTMTITPDSLRQAMAQDMLRELISQPAEEWMRTANDLMMDLVTSGDFSGTTTDGAAPSANGFDGSAYTMPLATDSADTAPAVIANSNNLVTWADRAGGTFAAGHDHVDATAGAWNRAVGRAQRDLITEHPNQAAVDAFVGDTVAALVLADLEAKHGVSSGVSQIPQGVDFLDQGQVSFNADFGVPIPLGMLDQVRYWSVTDLPAAGGVYIARGTQPIEAFVGLRGEDGGLDAPHAWTERLHRELRGSRDNGGVEYGYRGHFGLGVRNPVGLAYALHV